MMLRKIVVALAAVLSLSVSDALAYETPWFNFSGSTQGKADVDNKGGEYSVSHATATAGYRWFTLSYTRSEYDWSHTRALPFAHSGTPWEHMNLLSFDAKTDGRFSDTLGWFVGGTIVSGFEEEMKDSFSVMPRAGVDWDINMDFRLRAGVVGVIAPAHSMVLPLVGLDWRTAQDDGFSFTLGAPRTELRYRFSPAMNVYLASSWARTLHRLADDSSVLKEGYVEESGYTTGLYLGITPIDNLQLTVGAEMMTGRSMRLYDNHGNREGKYDVEDSMGGVLRLNYAF